MQNRRETQISVEVEKANKWKQTERMMVYDTALVKLGIKRKVVK